MLGYHQQLTTPLCDVVHSSSDRQTFQIFLRNPRNNRRRKFPQWEIEQFNCALLRSSIRKYVIHAPYIMNPASPDDELRNSAKGIIQSDMELLSELAGQKFYVLHPGSHKGVGLRNGWRNLLSVLEGVDTYGTTICIENMAGGGTELFHTISELDYFKCAVPYKIAFDTAHCFESGHDPIEVFEAYKELIAVVHLNGSATVFNSRRDVHANFHDSFWSLRRRNSPPCSRHR